ncbi:TRIC cation channel family protein [Corynebacterium endometrii]
MLALYGACEFSGIFPMGVMGGLIALEREYDLFGFILIALVSAPGGVPSGGFRA